MKNQEGQSMNGFNSILQNYRDGKICREKAKELLDALKNQLRPVQESPASEKPKSESCYERATDVAVIGMSGQFPHAKNVQEFWLNLIEGRCALGELPPEYLELDVPPEFAGGAKPYRWGGVLEDRDCFDPLFFQIAPREAKSMNPHQRLILQEGWKALEDAGVNPETLAGRSVGVFVGAEPTGYFFESFTGYSDSIVAARISYFLNLHGPAIVVNTACSSSGAAIHLACESLRNRESSLALAGGAYAKMDQSALIKMAEVGMLSPTGRCHSFDASGDGTVMSEGVGVVVLKRLDDAVADGDNIYGVIIASGVNQDGASNGITAPNGLAQEKLYADVYERFGVDPREITYIEAHGTGTKLGDPVETNALVRYFRRLSGEKSRCAMGSAKAHVGHTGAAACVVSLIKTLLSIQHGRIPGLTNFQNLNPLIEFDGSSFFVNRDVLDWRSLGAAPMTAAINSFGHSGTNVHLVVREHRPPQGKTPSIQSLPTQYLIPLSALNPERLKVRAENLLAFFDTENIMDDDLLSLAFTLQIGRKAMKTRVVFLVSTLAELKEKMFAFVQGKEDIDNCWRSSKNKISVDNCNEESNATLTPLDRLNALAQRWIQGEVVDWETLYEGDRPTRMRLPVYPFAKERYWIPRRSPAPTPISTPEAQDLLLLESYWNSKPLESKEDGERESFERRSILIIAFDDKLNKDIKPVMKNTVLSAVHLSSENAAEIYQDLALKVFEEIKRLMQSRPKKNVLIQLLVKSGFPHCLVRGIQGLFNTAHLENPKLFGQIIECDENHSTAELACILEENSQQNEDRCVRYLNGQRQVMEWREIESTQDAPKPWKEGGVYLITGGMGGLGGLFAKEIIQQIHNPVLILTGRSPLNEAIRDRISSLKSNEAIIEYIPCDVCNAKSVKELFRFIQDKYERLDGVIHSAGVIQDSYILKKHVDTFLNVLHPKTVGLVNLDEASRHFELDFFAFFSSLAGVMGNPGQGDYAAANGFMDAYAEYRNERVGRGECRGKTVSIDWPLWRDGGLTVSAEVSENLRERLGLASLSTDSGVQAFYKSLSTPAYCVLPMTGDIERLRTAFISKPAPSDINNNEDFETRLDKVSILKNILENIARVLNVSQEEIDPHTDWMELGFDPVTLTQFTKALNTAFDCKHTLEDYARHTTPAALAEWLDERPSTATDLNESRPIVNVERFRQKAVEYFKKQFSEIIDLPVERIDAESSLEEYGIDSIIVMQMTGRLEKQFGTLSKTLFFEYQTLAQVVDHFLEAHVEKLTNILGFVDDGRTDKNETKKVETNIVKQCESLSESSLHESQFSRSTPIAIVGLAGKYPKANNVREFWNNVRDGRNCITEIPKERWDSSRFFDSDKGKFGTTYSRWGGFIDDADCFDPLFFNMSPQEAEFRDPQERLFLECVHDLLEDAGYTKDRLNGNGNEARCNKVGVYVGVTFLEYQLYGAEEQLQGRPVTLSASASSIANRISYYFNFRGPSMAVDTMCSSSLTALHLACQSIQNGECRYAVAGGVNLSVHPNKYLMLGMGKILSSDGLCKSFGKDGDGYVPAEGIGAVLLKPLTDAIADGDCIYGVIRGTSANHGGKTNGYSVPNPNAIADAVREAARRTGVDLRTLSYLEAHGTGTALGDPIEISGLTKAFREGTGDRHFCAIGSVKSNIGHCESAAGVAALTKVLMQMHHCQLAPSIHADELNPNIDFESSPFFVQRELSPWNRLVLSMNGETREYPRIAGISAFGAGGANAHVLIEEYISPSSSPIEIDTQNPAVIVLSARDGKGLRGRAERLLHAIEIDALSNTHLADLAYTLQVGREAMRERLAFTVFSVEELEIKLNAFLENAPISDGFSGRVERNEESLFDFSSNEEKSSTVYTWIKEKEYRRILPLWVKGLSVDWEKLYETPSDEKGDENERRLKPKRIHLPGYPFNRQRYWIPGHHSRTTPSNTGILLGTRFLHPLLHQNTSDISELKFSSFFSGEEPFFTDHQVLGERVLPGVAYLEMARSAAERVTGKSSDCIHLKNVIWGSPVVANLHQTSLHIRLFPEDNGEMSFEIYSTPDDRDNNPRIHSQGRISFTPHSEFPSQDINELKSQCREKNVEASRCYDAFKSMGIEYGPSHRGIESIVVGECTALAKLRIALSSDSATNDFYLHPSIMDSALQSTVGFMIPSEGEETFEGDSNVSPALPFALDELEILRPTTETMWAIVRLRNGGRPIGNVLKIDIDLCNTDGKTCVRLIGYSSRIVKNSSLKKEADVRPIENVAMEPVSETDFSPCDLLERTEHLLKKVVAPVIKLSEDQIETDVPLEEYGLDSVMIMYITSQLEEIFGSLTKTLLFEYENLRALAQYFVESHTESLQNWLGIEISTEPSILQRTNNTQSENSNTTVLPQPKTIWSKKHSPAICLNKDKSSIAQTIDTDIAIIGLAGRYPGAENVSEFWENLKSGKDCISTIPKNRWDNSEYYDDNLNRLGKIYADWGGFISDVDRFDARFFEIPEREAEWADPNERLFLEIAFHLLQDAGYTRTTIQQRYGGNVGVFVGNMYRHYHLLAPDAVKESVLSILSSDSYIANRVSYYFNLHGPSLSIDAKSASSLTAIHTACQSLLMEECQLAIAGGVNLTLHPNKYLGLCNLNLIASRADSRSFGNGDGFIPAEGVGAVLLKPLPLAEEDGDFIYAVIKSTGVCHKGHTRGFTAPNPQVQAQWIEDLLTRAKIEPNTLQYIEADANGASLSDVAEFNAVGRVFSKFFDTKQTCAMGAVKANIGDTEAASGIAQLTKVALQLWHKTLVPTFPSSKPNPDIHWKDSPFYLVDALSEWKPSIDREPETPRRALVHSFGMGGTYAQVIVEEYIEKRTKSTDGPSEELSPQIFTFSAHTRECLNVVAKRMHDFICQHETLSLPNLAFTLHNGREAMPNRLAIVATTRKGLLAGLDLYLETNIETDDFSEKLISGIENSDAHVYAGDPEKTPQTFKRLLSGRVEEALVQALLLERHLPKIAFHWSQGGNIEWQDLHKDRYSQIPGLPLYPFEKQRYWIAPADSNLPKRIPASIISNGMPYTPDPGLSVRTNMLSYLREVASEFTKIPIEDSGLNKPIREWDDGLSLQLWLMRAVEEAFELKITKREMDDYPTLNSLCDHLSEKTNGKIPEKDNRLSHTSKDNEKSQIRYPLSEGQKGLWILQRLYPEMSVYNIPLALRINVSLDLTALQKSIDFTLRKYPDLNSAILEEGGEPRLVCLGESRCIVRKTNIDDCNEEKIRKMVEEKQKQPFNLETGPLLRVELFSRKTGGDIVLISVHHIVIDGTSVMLLLDTIWSAYNDFSKNREPIRAKQDTTYNDFVQWERDMLSGPDGRDHLNYWKKQLSGNLSVLNLPVDRAYTAKENFRGETLKYTISTELSKKVKEFSASERITQPVLFLGIFKILLWRYTRESDIIVGMPVMGRPQTKFESVLGYFVNTIPIRSRLSGDRSFLEFLKTLLTDVFEGLSHSAYPLPALIKEIKPQRDRSLANLFQVTFTYQNFIQHYIFNSSKDSSSWDFSIEQYEGVYQDSDDDLAMEIYYKDDCHVIYLKYDPDRFDAISIQCMMDRYVQMLESAIEHPDCNIERLDVLSNKERERIIHRWDCPETECPVAKTVYEVFAERASKNLNDTALVLADDSHQSMTYGELLDKVNRTVLWIHANGIGLGDRVGVCIERSLDAIVGMLAVFASGACYLPLDPDEPIERLRGLIQDAQMKTILVRKGTEEKIRLLEENDFQILNVDSLPTNLEPRNRSTVSLDSPAYIIYTSGSTGVPKGVVISHRSLATHNLAIRDYYQINSEDKILQFASFTVDTSLEQILPGLTAGATIVVKGKNVWTAKEFTEKVIENELTTIDVPPSYLRELIDCWNRSPQSERLKTLRLCVVGGEAILPETALQWMNGPMKSVRLVNAYGPTETTITSTVFDITAVGESIDLSRNIPIGKPLPHASAYILDEKGNLLPEGIPGELYIGGEGVALEYFHRPELTNECFIPDPFNFDSQSSKARLYRTGDRARFIPGTNGLIEFMGRLDCQIKIRGFRIEPGEIESCLSRFDGIRQCAVIPIDNNNGDTELIAFIVSTEEDYSEENIQDRFSRYLPRHMIPKRIMRLASFPMTSSGKVDRKALSVVNVENRRQESGSASPRDEWETRLVRIWADILNRNQIGIHDDFFELGGHSLLAVRLASRIEAEFGVNVSLNELIEKPTIAQLSDSVRCDGKKETGGIVVTLQPEGNDSPIFCVHPIGGTVYPFLPLVRCMGNRRPLYALQSPGFLDERIPPTIEDMASLYITALRRIQKNGPFFLSGWSMGGIVAYEMAQQLERIGERVERLILIESYTPSVVQKMMGVDGDFDAERLCLVQFALSLFDATQPSELPESILGATQNETLYRGICDRVATLGLFHEKHAEIELQKRYKIFKANYEAMNRYAPKPYSGNAILVSACDMEEITGIECPTKGWDGLIQGELIKRTVKGDHVSILKEPNVQALSTVLNECMDICFNTLNS